MTDRTWTAGGADNKASTADNWDGTPEAGDALIVGFDARGIDWDLAVSPSAVTFQGAADASGNMAITLSVNQVFTGALLVKSLHATATVTLATSTFTLSCGALTLGDRGCLSQTGTDGNITCTSYTQSGAGSVLTGNVDATFTCSGDFTQTNGIIVYSPSRLLVLYMNGANATLAPKATFAIHSLRINGNTTTTTANIFCNILKLDAEAVVTMSNVNIYVDVGNPTTGSFVNYGNIQAIGTGTLIISFPALSDNTRTIYIGKVSAPTIIGASAGVVAHKQVILGSNADFGSSVILRSDNGGFTCTLDLAGFALSCTTLTVGVRGILTASLDSTITGDVVLNDAAAVMTQTATKSLSISGSLTLTLGTITQLGNISVGSYSQAGGTMTGSQSYWFTCSGSFSKSAGTLTGGVLCLLLTGTGTCNAGASYAESLYKLRIYGTYTYNTSAGYINSPIEPLYVSGTLIMNGLNIYSLSSSGVRSINGGGIIRGVLAFQASNSPTVVFNVDVTGADIRMSNIGGDGSTVTLKFGGNISVDTLSYTAPGTRVVAFDINGYNAILNRFTAGTRNVLLGGEGAITINGGAWDSSAGTFTEETSTVVMNGASTIKLAAGQAFYNLLVTNTRTLSSDISVTNYFVHARDLVLGAYSLTMTDALKNLGSWVLHPVCNAVRTPNISSAENYILRYVAK